MLQGLPIDEETRCEPSRSYRDQRSRDAQKSGNMATCAHSLQSLRKDDNPVQLPENRIRNASTTGRGPVGHGLAGPADFDVPPAPQAPPEGESNDFDMTTLGITERGFDPGPSAAHGAVERPAPGIESAPTMSLNGVGATAEPIAVDDWDMVRHTPQQQGGLDDRGRPAITDRLAASTASVPGFGLRSLNFARGVDNWDDVIAPYWLQTPTDHSTYTPENVDAMQTL